MSTSARPLAKADLAEQLDEGPRELDLPALRRALGELSRDAEEAQARVLATVEARDAEFLAASSQVGDLRGTLLRLRSDLRQASQLLGGDKEETPSDGQAIATLQAGLVPKRLRTVSSEHASLQLQLTALDAAVEALTTVLDVHERFEELDALTGAGRFGEAAELTLEIAKALEKISARSGAGEPAMLQAAKADYYQRRAILASRLEDALNQLVTFADCCALARQSVLLGDAAQSAGAGPVAVATLPQVWDALRVLGLRGRCLEQLATEALQALLQPLLEAARQLRPGRKLRPKVSSGCEPFSASLAPGAGLVSSEAGCATWTWIEVQDEAAEESRGEDPPEVAASSSAKGLRKQPPVRVVLATLESLFIFAQEHWAGGLSEVYSALGCRLYPWVARCLLKWFDTCGADGGQELEHFELAVFAKGFIGKGETTLSWHVHQHRHVMDEQRRCATLAEARSWLMADEHNGAKGSGLVHVSDASVRGSVTQLLGDNNNNDNNSNNNDNNNDNNNSSASSCDFASAAQASGLVSGVDKRLREALQDDEGLLRLPEMNISGAADKLVKRIWDLQDQLVAVVREGNLEAARDINKLLRELCSLFSVLRPYSQKSLLKTDAKCCAVFLADCLYLVHILILAPYSHGQQLPSEHRQLAFFVDLVPQLRRLGENHFLAMLRHQKEQLVQTLKPCCMGPGIAKDRAFVAAEAALGAAAQQLKEACQGLAAALPAQLLRESAVLLVGAFCRDLLGKLLRPLAQSAQVSSSASLGPLGEALATPPLARDSPKASVGANVPTESGGRSSVDLTRGVGRLFHFAESLGPVRGQMGDSGAAGGGTLPGARPSLGSGSGGCLSSEEFSCLAALLSSALSLGRQALAAAELLQPSRRTGAVGSRGSEAGDAVLSEVPGWNALSVAADLLGSDFSRFLENRHKLLKALSKDEAIRLMQLSWRDEALSPKEAWGVLLRAE